MGLFEQFPYTNFHELNLDWFLSKFKTLLAEWEAMGIKFKTLQDAVDALHDYVYSYFDNLDVQQEINNKLDEMYNNGELAIIISAYLNSYVTPQMFGAVADGVNDDRPAIQDAIEYAASNDKIVYMPPGTYLIDSLDPNRVDVGVSLRSGVILKGSGRDVTFIKASNNYAGLLHVLEVQNASNVFISDLTVDGGIISTYPPSDYCHGIRLDTVSNVIIERVRSCNVSGYGIGMQGGSAKDLTLENIIVDHCGRDGIDFKNFNDSNSGITLHNIRVEYIGLGPNQNVDYYTAIDIRGSGVRISDIYIDNVSGVNSGLRFKNDSALQGTGGKKCVATNLYIRGDAANIPGAGLNPGEGIRIDNDEVEISNAVIVDYATGVRITGDRNNVSNITIMDAHQRAVRVDGTGNIIRGIVIDAASAMGLDIRNGHNTFSDIRLEACDKEFDVYAASSGIMTDIKAVNSTTPGTIVNAALPNWYVTNIETPTLSTKRQSFNVSAQSSVTVQHLTATYYNARLIAIASSAISTLRGLYLLRHNQVTPVVDAAEITITATNDAVTIAHTGTAGTANVTII